MKELAVNIEKQGTSLFVGTLSGNTADDICFRYDSTYCDTANAVPISISLPFSKEPFTSEQTKNFFEGLLPEGFTRRCVATWMHADENDYIALLEGLGRECLGALRILPLGEVHENRKEYRRLSSEELKELSNEGVSESAQMVTKAHLSLTGASGKIGLYYDDKNREWYLPTGDAPSTHIVKQSHIRLMGIIANEQLCQLTAGALGIEIPESFVINTGDIQKINLNRKDNDILFATRRYDRAFADSPEIVNKLPIPLRLHQEDFAQALGIPAAEKYEKNQEHYLAKMFDLLKRYSSNPIEDMLRLWDILIFQYLIGDTDNHIKNYSLLYGSNLRSIRLAPAYDLISTVIYESSTTDMAMSIDGVYDIGKITRNSFLKEAEYLGLGVTIAMKHFDRITDQFCDKLEKMAEKLSGEGFEQAESIYKNILSRGGMRRL